MLDDALQQSLEVQYKVKNVLHGFSFSGGERGLLIAALLDLSLEHHFSIITLIKKDLPSSAAALLRPLLEAVYRASWLITVADEAKAQSIVKNDKFHLSIGKMANEIDAKLNIMLPQDDTAGPFNVFTTYFNQAQNACNGFTHGDMHQLGRRFQGKYLRHSFTEGELCDMLNGINRLLALCLLGYAEFTQNEEIGQTALALYLAE